MKQLTVTKTPNFTKYAHKLFLVNYTQFENALLLNMTLLFKKSFGNYNCSHEIVKLAYDCFLFDITIKPNLKK